MDSLAVGFGLGFLVALQLGPMSLLLVRSTLVGGFRTGAAIGAGIAVIDTLYAALGAAGVAPLLTISQLRVVLGLVGATVLVGLGARTIRQGFRRTQTAAIGEEFKTVRRAFSFSLAATGSNPLTILSWAAIFSATSASGQSDDLGSGALLVTGVGIGSAAWVLTLATAVAALRVIITARLLRAIDLAAGAGLIAFGCVLAFSVVWS